MAGARKFSQLLSLNDYGVGDCQIQCLLRRESITKIRYHSLSRFWILRSVLPSINCMDEQKQISEFVLIISIAYPFHIIRERKINLLTTHHSFPQIPVCHNHTINHNPFVFGSCGYVIFFNGNSLDWLIKLKECIETFI